MAEEMVKATPDLDIDIERVLIGGDLSKLTPNQRLSYLKTLCESLGLNIMTQPFEYLVLNGKLVLYAKKAAAEQLRLKHGVSVTGMTTEIVEGVYVVTVTVQNAKGRTDMGKGAVNIAGLRGDALANGIMKAETKAKRRATLSICGLGMLDESEIETIPNAQPFDRDAYVSNKVAELKGETRPAAEPEHSATDTKADNELRDWQRVIKACKTAADLNALLPKARKASDEAKLLVMAAAKRIGARFDSSLVAFVDDAELSEADANAPQGDSAPKRGTISKAQNIELQKARQASGIPDEDYYAALHGIAGVTHGPDVDKRHFDAILREVSGYRRPAENPDAEPVGDIA